MLRSVTAVSIRRPFLVIAVWLVVVVGALVAGVGVFDRLVSDVGAVPGSESERAWTTLGAVAPPESVRITAVIEGAPAAAVAAAVADLRGLAGVADVSEPVPSTATGRAVLLNVGIRTGPGVAPAARAVDERLRRVESTRVVVAGGPLTADEFNVQAQADVQRAELLSTPVVLLLLLLVFGGILAAGLPLLIAVVGAGGTLGVLYTVSLFTDVSVYAIQVATMLSVGLAVDYALLMLSRFREERAADPDVTSDVSGAVARTGASAGRTVLFSGLTVAAALAGLLVFPDPFLRSLGVAGIAVVMVVVAAALTLLPALLVVAGGRITAADPGPTGSGAFATVARIVQRRPLLTALAATGAMTVLALPLADLRLAQVDARLLPTATQSRQLHDALATHYPEDSRTAPVVIVARTPGDDTRLPDFRGRVAALPGVTEVEVTAAGPVTVLRAEVEGSPTDDTARRTVAAVRGIAAPFDVAVTGDAAMLVDYEAMLWDRLPWAAVVVGLGTLVLLFLLTRSVLLPVKAVLTNLLSIAAALGVVVWVFQQGHLAGWFGTVGLGALYVSVPVVVAAIAFGLSADYEVFLLSRIKERWLAGVGSDRAVAEGLQRTGRIVTCAALLLAVVFAGFLAGGFVPVQAIGLGLVLAVGLDATVVRMLLVPATMTLFGRYNWWAPGPLRARAGR